MMASVLPTRDGCSRWAAAARRSARSCLALSISLAIACTLRGADSTKRPLSHRDFDGWREIDSIKLARDGAVLAYSYMPQVGDGEIIVRQLATSEEQRVAVGALPPRPLTGSDKDPERPAPRRKVSIDLTSDDAFAVATLFPAREAALEARRTGKKPDERPREGIVIVNIATRGVTHIPGVKSFQIPDTGGSWLAYLKTADGTDSEEGDAGTDEIQTDRKIGTDLVLTNLADGTETTFGHVLEYSFARDGQTLLFTVGSPNPAENGVYAVTPGANRQAVALASGPGRYEKLAWDRLQTQAAFISNRADPVAKSSAFAVYQWKRGSEAAHVVFDSTTKGIPEGYEVSQDAAPSYSFDGDKLFVSTAPMPRPRNERLDKLLDEEKVEMDLWRWNDDEIQPLQKVRAGKERKRAYQGVLDLASGRFVQVADPTLQTVTFSDDGTRAFGFDDRPYKPRIDYDGEYRDAYAIDATTGDRQLIARELGEDSGMRWSSDNRWIAYYHGREWFAFDAATGRTVALTHDLPIAFFNELDDQPEAPPSYGTGGWTSDGASLLVYDRYDVWQVFPDGRPARNLTSGFGRNERIQLRIQNIEPRDPEDDTRGIDPTQPLTLRGESETTRDTGYFRTPFASDAAPTRLLWAEKSFRYIGRAQDHDTLMLTASRFDEFPDVHVTDSSFADLRKVTHGGDQLEPFQWGSDELIHYRSTDGVPLDAMLCKPANFDPGKKYPMIVYIYERLSPNLHRFFEPAPLPVIEPSFYTSNGYLILMPDIVYTEGHPGQSAYRCVMPAVDEVVRRGFVDEDAIGLEGHSWGGYETAYIITQTDRFRAAEAGAIVSNMTSAYGAVGISSGRSRQFKYEKTQSRIGATPQEAPLLYLENSPVYFADRVHTPLLILHDDEDDIVPWPQAVEYFLSLRRYGKEVYLINYNREFHSPRQRAARDDFARRMHQFFDHFLKGAAAPDWMANGIPFLDRDAEKLRFRESN